MAEKTFNIHDLASMLADSIIGDLPQDCPALLAKITPVLQRNIDIKLVPRNYNIYETRKKRDSWVRSLREKDSIIKFWKDKVRESEPEKMESHYSQLNQLLKLSGFRPDTNKDGKLYCFYCEREIDAAKFGGENGIHATQDHILPKSKFGKTHYTNLILACNECNLFKAAMTVGEFIAMLEKRIAGNIEHEYIPVSLYRTIHKNAQRLLDNINNT